MYTSEIEKEVSYRVALLNCYMSKMHACTVQTWELKFMKDFIYFSCPYHKSL